jgi:hypothetical protein
MIERNTKDAILNDIFIFLQKKEALQNNKMIMQRFFEVFIEPFELKQRMFENFILY